MLSVSYLKLLKYGYLVKNIGKLRKFPILSDNFRYILTAMPDSIPHIRPEPIKFPNIMTTIRTKLRKSSVPGHRGTVVYQIIHRRKVRTISSSVRISLPDWELLHETMEDSSLSGIRTKIECGEHLLHSIVDNLEREGRPYTADDIIRLFREGKKSCLFVEFIREESRLMKENGRYGTARNYISTANSFSEYLGNSDLPIQAVTCRIIENYSNWLTERGVCRNSLSFYMRILRAAFNKAVREGLAQQTFPFSNVYTGIERTPKRAVSEETVSTLYRMVLPDRSPLSLARDLFLFSFCTRGMSFVDMAYLKKTDIRRGVIRYRRHKTGQRIEVRLERVISNILDKHTKDSSSYVFPILEDTDSKTAYRRYRSMLRYYNRLLDKLSSMTGTDCHLTSYTARHTWASAARSHGVNLPVISAAMGHTSEKTTSIYLADIDRSLIDSANREIIGRLECAVSS